MTAFDSTQLKNLTNARMTDSIARYGSTAPGLPLIEITTDHFEAVIAPQGAQLLEFNTKDHKFLWVSPLEKFTLGKSIRGGIPISAPWFGIHPTKPSNPKHGIVRDRNWQLTSASQTGSTVELTFSIQSTPQDKAYVTCPFTIELTMRLSDTLELSLTLHNQGSQLMRAGWAFHTYFAISNLANITVSGLENHIFLEATQNLEPITENHPIRFSSEIDRVYENTQKPQIIKDSKEIKIEGTNCPTCIVWNPGQTLAATVPNIAEHYVDYVCVERGAAFNDSWLIPAGKQQTATMKIQQ